MMQRFLPWVNAKTAGPAARRSRDNSTVPALQRLFQISDQVFDVLDAH